jgi:hypothetical protein
MLPLVLLIWLVVKVRLGWAGKVASPVDGESEVGFGPRGRVASRSGMRRRPTLSCQSDLLAPVRFPGLCTHAYTVHVPPPAGCEEVKPGPPPDDGTRLSRC